MHRYLFDDITGVNDDKQQENDDDESLLGNIPVYIHIDDSVTHLDHRQHVPLMTTEEHHYETSRLSLVLVDENYNNHHTIERIRCTLEK